ncbi:MAG: hypothetical protein CME06_10135 [Gemmatimonadetes bacterium]|nr:hypothetical protein [Gemmatimonadota bacterium]
MGYRAFIFTAALAACAHAAIIRVPGDQPTIQAGLDSASEGDTVLVASGTYTGAGNRNLDFRGRDLVLESEAGAEATVIDCERAGRGLSFHSGETAASVVNGFTIAAGMAREGGGVACLSSNPTFTDCTITNNSAESGGGVACHSSNPTLTDCTITNNSAESGGGVACLSSNPTLITCRIAANTVEMGGGGMGCIFSSPALTGCTITGNTTTYSHGGAIALFESLPRLTNCTINGNSATNGSGGSLWIFDSNPSLTNCILWGNEPDEISGAHHYPGDPRIRYCDVEGGWDDVGNINVDPLFVSIPGFSNLLRPGSPCIDAGDPSISDGVGDWHPRWPDWYPNGARSDMGAYGGPGNARWLP